MHNGIEPDDPMCDKERLIRAMSKVRWLADMLDHHEDDPARFPVVISCVRFPLEGGEFAAAYLRELSDSILDARVWVRSLPPDYPLRREALKRLEYVWESFGQMDVPCDSAVRARDFAAARAIAKDVAGKVHSECGRGIRSLAIDMSVDCDTFDDDRRNEAPDAS